MKNTGLFAFVFLFIGLPGLFPSSVWAGEAGLYDPVAPDGSAFVRFLNASAGPAQSIRANGKFYSALEYRDVSAYFVVPQGAVKISFGDSRYNFEAVAGKFYTLVKTTRLQLQEDAANDNRAKSQILFYNLGNRGTLSLKTADGKIAIVDAVASGTASSRQINPVKLAMGVYQGETKRQTLDPVVLERGMSYSAIILDDGAVLWIKSRTDTTR